MRRLLTLAGICLLVSPGIVRATDASTAELSPSDLATWPRMRATDFGCMLEKRFGTRDARFNCASDFDRMNWGDACRDVDHYYAGPALPPAIAKTLPSPIESIDIAWEQGRMQNVSITFDRKVSEGDVEALLGLRIDGPMPDNIGSADIQDCATGKSCLVLQGFDHQGAGDLDCDAVASPETGG